MNKFAIVMVLSGVLLAGCGQNTQQVSVEEAPAAGIAKAPKEALNWCQYNQFQSDIYGQGIKAWHAAHPHTSSIPDADQDKMDRQYAPKLKAERERVFGKMSDQEFASIDAHALTGGWYEQYCVAKQPEQAWAPVVNSTWDGSVEPVKNWIKKNLNDADSFEAVEWSAVVKVDDGYLVRCKFRAKNAYGAYILSNAVFKLDRQGSVVNVSGLN